MEISSDIKKIVVQVHSLLLAGSETLSTAESLTGGGLSSAFTDPPGASHVFMGGITAYRTEIKIKELHVPPEIIEKYGVVSSQVADAMAQGAQKVFGSTWAISTTGVAGPGPSDGIAQVPSGLLSQARSHIAWNYPSMGSVKMCETRR